MIKCRKCNDTGYIDTFENNIYVRYPCSCELLEVDPNKIIAYLPEEILEEVVYEQIIINNIEEQIIINSILN